jgi:IS30 family transposase
VKWFSEEDKETIWDVQESGVPIRRIASRLGKQNCSVRKFIADAGGIGHGRRSAVR